MTITQWMHLKCEGLIILNPKTTLDYPKKQKKKNLKWCDMIFPFRPYPKMWWFHDFSFKREEPDIWQQKGKGKKTRCPLHNITSHQDYYVLTQKERMACCNCTGISR